MVHFEHTLYSKIRFKFKHTCIHVYHSNLLRRTQRVASRLMCMRATSEQWNVHTVADGGLNFNL